MSSNTQAMALAWSVAHLKHCLGGESCFGWVRVEFPVGHPLFGAAIPCPCRRNSIARANAEALRRESGLGDVELQNWTFGTFDASRGKPLGKATRRETTTALEGIVEVCQGYADRPEGWLILQGGVGTGKTHLAYAIAGRQLALGRGVFAHTVPDILDILKGGFKDDSYERWVEVFKSVPLLVLDDLGTEKESEWVDQVMFQVINTRYSKRLPMVVTTNQDLRAVEGSQRLVSRLLEGSDEPGGWSRVVSMPCGDFRRKR